MEVGYKKPPVSIETQFKPNNAGKPVGARMKQVTQFRRYLEKKRAVNDLGEEIDKKLFLLKTQLEKAEQGDTVAAKFCMDYAGYKPVERVEMDDGEGDKSFQSEQDELDFRRNRIIELQREAIKRSGEVVNEAEAIIAQP
jgi:hypothetical protein